MTYKARTIKDRIATGDDCFYLENLPDGRVKLIPAPDEVVESGTDVNKALLQPMEECLEYLANNSGMTIVNYTGDGTDKRLIEVDFPPRFVMILLMKNMLMCYKTTSLNIIKGMEEAIDTMQTDNIYVCVDTGFYVGRKDSINNDLSTNVSECEYIAICWR